MRYVRACPEAGRAFRSNLFAKQQKGFLLQSLTWIHYGPQPFEGCGPVVF